MTLWRCIWNRVKCAWRWSQSAHWRPEITVSGSVPESLNMCENDPHFLNNVITGEEFWILSMTRTKGQSFEWHTSVSPYPKKARMSKSKVKTMLIVVFDIKGVVHHEFIPPGQPSTPNFMLKCSRDSNEGSIGSYKTSQPTGSCITTTSWLTLPFLWTATWPRPASQRFRSWPRGQDNAFNAWKSRWWCCIDAEGAYFESFLKNCNNWLNKCY